MIISQVVKTVKLGRGMGKSNNFMVKLWDSLHDTQWNIGITLWNALTVGEECLLCLFKWYSKTQYNADEKCLWWRMSYPQSLHTSESRARSFGVDMDQDDWSEITGITVYQEKGVKAHSLSCNDNRPKFFCICFSGMDTQNLQTEIQWPLYERNFLKFFFINRGIFWWFRASRSERFQTWRSSIFLFDKQQGIEGKSHALQKAFETTKA